MWKSLYCWRAWIRVWRYLCQTDPVYFLQHINIDIKVFFWLSFYLSWQRDFPVISKNVNCSRSTKRSIHQTQTSSQLTLTMFRCMLIYEDRHETIEMSFLPDFLPKYHNYRRPLYVYSIYRYVYVYLYLWEFLHLWATPVQQMHV